MGERKEPTPIPIDAVKPPPPTPPPVINSSSSLTSDGKLIDKGRNLLILERLIMAADELRRDTKAIRSYPAKVDRLRVLTLMYGLNIKISSDEVERVLESRVIDLCL